MTPRPEFSALPEDLEAAVQFVKDTDYIQDENRQIAGNSFLAGMYFERGKALKLQGKNPIPLGHGGTGKTETTDRG